MSAAPFAVLTHVLGRPGGADLAVFESLLDDAFLTEAGWDAGRMLLVTPPEHPLLGLTLCRVVGCGTRGRGPLQLCGRCAKRLPASGLPLAEFLAVPWTVRTAGLQPCAVPGCARPWATSSHLLCHAHKGQRKAWRLPLDVFLADPRVQPLPAHPPCRVAACSRDGDTGDVSYCKAHRQRLVLHRRGNPALDEVAWRATEPGIDNDPVSLRGLPPLVVAQLLFGLQQRTRRGCKTVRSFLRRVCDLLRQTRARRVEELAPPKDRGQREVWSELVTHARRALQDPETEIAKDVWDGAVFGRRGFVTFTEISQPWLREATKRWAAEYLARLRSKQANGIVQARVSAVAALSQSLRAGRRHDRGNIITAVGRADIEAFLHRLTLRQSRGEITEHGRVHVCQWLARILARMRTMGLTRAGEMLHGLPDDFAVRPEDVPEHPDPGEPGRDLPVELLRLLCQHLPQLEDIAGRDVRVAVELLIDTGRRPSEIAGLGLDCLARDGDGGPVLVYDNGKSARLQRRLPIGQATAELIIGQQQAVRRRYPATPIGELALLPSPVTNPHGRRPIVESTISDRHRAWVATVPLALADGTIVDRSKIVPYCYRHTYAQRHADAGVPIDVLRELLDHKRLDTVKAYYRVGEQRRRAAVDKVTAVQFDRHGTRVWREAKTLLDSERARRAVGEVVVPFGMCSEPTNVAAGGHDCPIRFRCLGCDHFSTDVSYLPDLEAYHADLLRNRERVLAMAAADDWAKAEAAPSDEEIGRVRRLIRRVKTDLDGLTAAERAQIEEAVATVRAHRPVALGMPRSRPPRPDVHLPRPA